jgi:RNA polymerase sigma factor (sigma-70 family)
MSRWSDEAILVALQDSQRRSEAFDALVKAYAPQLRGLLVKMCRGDRERAEDLLGIAFAKAYKGLVEAGTPCRSLEAWLYTVTARTALDDMRRKRASDDPLEGALQLKEEVVGSLPDPTRVEQCDEEEQRDTALADVFTKLEVRDPRYRTLLEMEYVGACSRDEIAEATGIDKRQLSAYIKAAKTQALKLARGHPVLVAWAQGLRDAED